MRRPYRALGRYRGSYSRPRRYQYDQPQQGDQYRTGISPAPEQYAKYTGQAADFEATATSPLHEIDESTGQQPDTVRTPVHFPNDPAASVKSVETPSATPGLELRTPERNEAMPSHVRPDQTPSLVSNITTTTEVTPSVTEQHDTSVTTNNQPCSSPTRPVNWQDLPFHNVTSLVHPSQAPEMVYAWYPYAVLSRDGAHTSLSPPPPPPPSLQSRLNLSSAAPPPPSLLQQAPPPPLVPPHLYFTNDPAFWALCPPLPWMPCSLLPIPYLRYWGPERVGAHPSVYDVPMVSLTRQDNDELDHRSPPTALVVPVQFAADV